MVASSPLSGLASRTRAGAVVLAVVASLFSASVGLAPAARAATADKLAPAIARAGGGITIGGTELAGTTGVTFLGSPATAADDVPAASFIVVDPKKVVAQIPAGAKSGRIAVTSEAGVVQTGIDAVIAQVPSISGLSAASLAPGATLTISGTHLLGVKKTLVVIGAKKAAPLPASTSDSLQIVVPAGLPGGQHTLAVTTEGGTAEEDFTIAPTIKSVVAPSGSTVGGSTITILGTGFTGVDKFVDDPATDGLDEQFMGVTIGGEPVRKLIAVSDTEIVAVTPPGTDAAARVVVRTTANGEVAASTSPVSFAYQPRPTVSSLSQDWNPVSPADPVSVTATGENLTDGTKVYFGTVQTQNVVADAGAGTLTFTPPPGLKPAVVKLTFVNMVGTASYATTVGFSYAAAPVVTKLAPASAPAGSSVAITGTGFVSGTIVTFGTQAANCKVATPVLLQCVVPAGAGAVDVIVTNGVGDSAPGTTSRFTYMAGTPAPPPPLPQASVSGLAPVFGTSGSTVALKGANLDRVTRVDFKGAETAWVSADKFLAVNPSRLVVTVPPRAASGALRLTTPAGRTLSGNVTYTASVRPSVTSIDVVGDATYGAAGGDMLTIKGAGLLVGTVRPVVTIGGKAAALLSRPTPTARTILVRVPASVGGRERVTVTTPLGSATAEASVYFTPQIKSVKPLSYNRSGGLPVTIGGTGFTGADALGDAAGGPLSAVTFGGIPVSRMVVMSDKEIVATTSNGSASVDLLLVRSQHSTWVGSSDEQVRATNLPVPTISSVTPPVAVLGTAPAPVTVSGTNLRASSTVRFGSAQGVVQEAADDGTSLVVIPPTRTSTARVDVSVTNVVLGEELVATLAGGFRYLPQPAVTSMTPTSGFTGVTPAPVTIAGANLRSASVVQFGDSLAVVDSVNGDGTRMVVTPPRRESPGRVNVTVTNIVDDEELSATVAGGYEYVLRAFPAITAVSPDNAVAGAPPGTVTISGENLLDSSVVRFGSAAATVQSAAPDGTSLVVVPPVGNAGSVSITITNTVAGDQLSTTQPGAFRYLPTPTITAVSPASGTVGVTQPTVTITGKNLLANSVVRFGGATGAIQNVASDGTSVTVTPPILENPGPVDVTVTNIVDGEPLTATLTSGYTYLSSQSPTITDVSPATGTTSVSNSDVTITGSKLRADTIVKFGSATATVVSVAGDGGSMVVTPPVSTTDGPVAVSVTNVVDSQQLTSAMASAYRYLPQPAIASISPNTGLTGATPPAVTITGTNLRLNSVVRFGSTSAVVSSAAPNGTSIVVTPPLSNVVGPVDVVVANIVDGVQQLTATSTNGYAYVLAAGQVTGMSAGTALPGTQVTLTGTSFNGVTAVRFGSVNATFSVASPTTIYATVPVTPADAQGTVVNVTVLNGTGEWSTANPITADDWTWTAHPLITGMTPSTGVEGSSVTITGTGFTGATAVRFGSIDASYTVVNDTTVTAVVPTSPSAGSVADVVVLARGLTSPEPLPSSHNDWTWHPVAVITKMLPNPAGAGTTVTVTGRNFTNVRKVVIAAGATPIDVTGSVVVQSSTSLTFTVPARPGGGGANRTDKPVYITNGSNVQSTAETDPDTFKAANLFTWL